MKRFISVLLVAIMIVGVVPFNIYARDYSKQELMAQELKSLGLFRGVSETNFDLERAPSRVEAVVMLVRALGKEENALNTAWQHPFTDVPAWADRYVGYAYEEKLANGQSADAFGNTDANAAMYITFVLRALGYSDGRGDFMWDNPYTLARQTGILTDDVDIENFTRADVVTVTHNALAAYCRNSAISLSSKLVDENVFTKEKYDSVYNSYMSSYSEKSEIAEVLSSEEIYKKCKSSVLYIEVYNEYDQAIAIGSGFFIDDKGTAVTNYHVIEDAYTAWVQVSEYEDEVYEVVGVYDYSEEDDWAVIKVDCTDNDYLNVGTTELVGGSTVYAIGNPLALKNTISQGIVSNPSRMLGNTNYIQITAPISSGSSGGALIDKNGDVVGITSATASKGQNLNLALPISYINWYDNSAVTPLNELVETAAQIIEYEFTRENIVVEQDKTEYVLFDYWYDYNNYEMITFTIDSGDETVALVNWESEDDEPLPWLIEVHGVSVGETSIIITNSLNDQVFTLPIHVTEAGSTTGTAYERLANWLVDNGYPFGDTYMGFLYDDVDEDGSYIQFTLCYHPQTENIMILHGERVGKDYLWAAISVLSKESETFKYRYEYRNEIGQEIIGLQASAVAPGDVGSDLPINYTNRICPDGMEEGFEMLEGLLSLVAEKDLVNSLQWFDVYLRFYVGGMSAADFGFTSIHSYKETQETQEGEL